MGALSNSDHGWTHSCRHGWARKGGVTCGWGVHRGRTLVFQFNLSPQKGVSTSSGLLSNSIVRPSLYSMFKFYYSNRNRCTRHRWTWLSSTCLWFLNFEPRREIVQGHSTIFPSLFQHVYHAQRRRKRKSHLTPEQRCCHAHSNWLSDFYQFREPRVVKCSHPWLSARPKEIKYQEVLFCECPDPRCSKKFATKINQYLHILLVAFECCLWYCTTRQYKTRENAICFIIWYQIDSKHSNVILPHSVH